MNRRLPVYILIDCSESMIGDGIRAVRSGLSQMLSVLRQDPHALETAYISVISFGAGAQVVIPLTELIQVQEPKIVLSQGTSLGAALDLLSNQIETEVVKSEGDLKGDYRPLIILLTDGQPTDDWQSAKVRFDNQMGKRVANFYVVGCGHAIDYKSLSKISDIVLSLPDMTPESMRKLFVWMTQTVTSASIGVSGQDQNEENFGIKILPKEIVRVNPEGDNMPTVSMQVFLPGICSLKKESRYLMRYVKRDNSTYFIGEHAHKIKLGDIELSEIKPLAEQQKVSLHGAIQCPYCYAEGWVQCEHCGIYFCTGILNNEIEACDNMNIQCPNCSTTLTLRIGGNEFEADFTRG